MAWSVPLTAVSNNALTAAQWNASVRDNFLETAPAKATAAGTYFAGTGANSIAQRVPVVDSISVAESTSSASFVALATPGASCTFSSGPVALMTMGSQMDQSTAGQSARHAYEVTGATAIAPNDIIAIGGTLSSTSAFLQIGMSTLHTGLTPGTNTFASRYKSPTGGTATFRNRRMAVLPF